jgi:F0F1-type ATP synthase delta subunit
LWTRPSTGCARVFGRLSRTTEARGRLAAKLEHALGGRRVLLEEIVGRRMLGGSIVESGGVVLDGSLEGQLERMRRCLGQEEAWR